MKTHAFATAVAALASAASPAFAAESPADAAAFLQKAASGGQAEVALGKLAQSQADSPEVKAFGARMVADHGKANAELQTLASKKGVTLPGLEPKQKDLHDELAALSGPTFDRAYMQAMVEDHDHDVAAFEQAAKSKDPEVQAFASKTLPTLEAHQTEARRIHADVTAGEDTHRDPSGSPLRNEKNPGDVQ